jgi:arsenate reductase
VLKIYGIPNCDTCRSARKWLDENNVEHEFHDVRADGLEIQMLERWASKVDWVTLLNTRSTTWRNLPAKDRDAITKSRALVLMLQHPTLVKRPIFEDKRFFAVGFSPRRSEQLLAKLA